MNRREASASRGSLSFRECAHMQDDAEAELIEVGDLDPDEWNDFAAAQGWSDGMPLMLPTEAAVAKFTAISRGDNEAFAPISPRPVVPTLGSLAANAVMAGCRPEYFPVVDRQSVVEGKSVSVRVGHGGG